MWRRARRRNFRTGSDGSSNRKEERHDEIPRPQAGARGDRRHPARLRHVWERSADSLDRNRVPCGRGAHALSAQASPFRRLSTQSAAGRVGYARRALHTAPPPVAPHSCCVPAALEDAREVLKRFFGYPDFRPAQLPVVESVLAGRDTLAVLPTGGGKSICYQVPALVTSGLTVVISPLISLMKDQVDRLTSRGVAAAFLNSTLDPAQVRESVGRIVAGELRLLYLAPERFEAADLQRTLAGRVALLAVDEAHCISEWGHDFRPSFRRIADVAAQIGSPQTIALTATATPAVRADIARQLRLRSPRVIVQGFDRENLHYAVSRCRNDSDKDHALLAGLRRHERPAIVYAATRSTVQRLATQLTRWGVPALPYHAGLDDEHRRDVQDRFMRGAVDTIVATNAFGMGIDKPDVRLVLHYTMPGTLEAYYQEAGRAGRDGRPARCILLHAYKDRFTHEWFINATFPERADVERTYVKLGRSAVDGVAASVSRDDGAAVRLLLQEGVLLQSRGGTLAHVRVLATPHRIRRELSVSRSPAPLAVMRALWRARVYESFVGVRVD